jgi:hypothetical protein
MKKRTRSLPRRRRTSKPPRLSYTAQLAHEFRAAILSTLAQACAAVQEPPQESAA